MKNKLFWLSAVLLAGIAWLFENNPGTLILLSSAVLLPIFGMLPLLFAPKVSARWELQAPPEKGGAGSGVLILKNESALFLPRLALELEGQNIRTGGNDTHCLTLALLPKQEKKIPFTLSFDHCGKIIFRIANAASLDLFGIARRTFFISSMAEVTVVPNLFPVELRLQQNSMSTPDSETYSATKPGSDPGEIFAIREYIPGDAIRKIHWKLSEKTDKLMSREFGLPVVNEVLLLLETGGAESQGENDVITEIFASLCQSLSEKGIAHHIGWRCEETGGLAIQPLSQLEDFPRMLSALLAVPPREDGSVAKAFIQEIGHCGYTHVMVVGGRIPDGIRDLYNGNRISVLIPYRNGVCEGLQPDGTYVMTFDADGYAAALSELEV